MLDICELQSRESLELILSSKIVLSFEFFKINACYAFLLMTPCYKGVLTSTILYSYSGAIR